MHIKAVLFDLDGVILDSEKIYSKFWKHAADELGFSLDIDTILQLRSCDSEIAKDLVEKATGIADSYVSIRKKRKELMSDYLKVNDLPLKPGVRDFLIALSKYQLKKIIVTSSDITDKIAILERNEVFRYFDDVISARSVKRNKPFPDVYNYACSILKISPHNCIAIEDSPNGVKSAYAAGLNVVMVPDLTDATVELRKMCTVVYGIDKVLDVIRCC